VPMFRLIWIASIHTRGFLHRYTPTNWSATRFVDSDEKQV